jgi:hypothetical protein
VINSLPFNATHSINKKAIVVLPRTSSGIDKKSPHRNPEQTILKK